MRPPNAQRWFLVVFVLLASLYPLSLVDGPSGVWLVQVVFQWMLGALALALALVSAPVPAQAPVAIPALDLARQRLGLNRSQLSVLHQAGMVVLGLLVLWGLSSLFPEAIDSSLGRSLAGDPPGDWALFASLVVLPAFFEEILFRGALQSMLTQRWGGVAAALVASGLFALFHAYAGAGVVLISFVIGLYLAEITRRARSIYPAMAIHAIHNTVVFAGLMS